MRYQFKLIMASSCQENMLLLPTQTHHIVHIHIYTFTYMHTQKHSREEERKIRNLSDIKICTTYYSWTRKLVQETTKVNLCVPNTPFLYPLKTSENLTVF